MREHARDLWHGQATLAEALRWLASLLVVFLTLGNLAANVAILGNRDNACTCLEGVTTLHTATQQQRYTNISTVTTTTTDVSTTTNQTVDARTFRNITTNVTVEQYYTVNDTTTTVTYVNETHEYGETIAMQTIYLNSNTSAQSVDPFVNHTRITATTHQNYTLLSNGTQHAQTLEITNAGSRAVEIRTNQATAVLESPLTDAGLHSAQLLWDADLNEWVTIDGTTSPTWTVDGFQESSKISPPSGGAYGEGLAINHDGSMIASSTLRSVNDEAVYVYETDENGVKWGSRTKIQASTSNWNYGYGIDLTPDGSRLVVGMPERNPPGTYVYRRVSRGNWVNEMNAVACTGSTNAYYCGLWILINAKGNIIVMACGNWGGIGGICTFGRSGTTWTWKSLLQVPAGYNMDLQGSIGIDASGTRAATLIRRTSDNSLSLLVYAIATDGTVQSQTLHDNVVAPTAGANSMRTGYMSADGLRFMSSCQSCVDSTSSKAGRLYIFYYDTVARVWTNRMETIYPPHDGVSQTEMGRRATLSSQGRVVCASSEDVGDPNVGGGHWCWHYSDAAKRFKLTTAVTTPPGVLTTAACGRAEKLSTNGRRFLLACYTDPSGIGSVFVYG